MVLCKSVFFLAYTFARVFNFPKYGLVFSHDTLISSHFLHRVPVPPPSVPFKPFSPVVRVHGDGSRLAQLRGDQHFPLPAVPAGDGDALVARVGPVNVLVDPVDGQALGGVERVNKRYLLRRVAGLVDVRAKREGKRSFVSCQSAEKRSIIGGGCVGEREKKKSKYCIFFLSKRADQV